jgi:hypothetical protein
MRTTCNIDEGANTYNAPRERFHHVREHSAVADRTHMPPPGSGKAPVPLIRATSRSGSVRGLEARAVNASRDAALAFLECDANEDGVLDWHEARPPTERGIVASTRRQHPRL